MVERLKPHQWGALISFTLVGLLCFWLGYQLYLMGIFSAYADPKQFRQLITDTGSYAPLTYLGLQALQVILAPIPGEFTGSIAGILFGGGWGAVYATGGLALGASAAFLLGRWVGMPLVRWLVSPEQLKRVKIFERKRTFWLVFAIFLIPGFPKDVATYFFALTPIPFWRFFWASQLGRLPGTIMLTYAGDALFEGNWPLFAGLTIIVVIVLIVGIAYRKRLIAWVQAGE